MRVAYVALSFFADDGDGGFAAINPKSSSSVVADRERTGELWAAVTCATRGPIHTSKTCAVRNGYWVPWTHRTTTSRPNKRNPHLFRNVERKSEALREPVGLHSEASRTNASEQFENKSFLTSFDVQLKMTQPNGHVTTKRYVRSHKTVAQKSA